MGDILDRYDLVNLTLTYIWQSIALLFLIILFSNIIYLDVTFALARY